MMSNRKPRKNSFLIWCTLSAVICAVCISMVFYMLRPIITDQSVVIQDPSIHLGNNQQYEASLFLFEFQGKLYFHAIDMPVSMSYYNGYLSVFDNGSARRVTQLNENVFATCEGFVYFESATDSAYDRDVSCYSISDNRELQLVTVENINSNSLQHGACFFGSDGVFYVPTNGSFTAFHPIIGDNVNESLGMNEMYIYGDNTIIIHQDEFGNTQISFTCPDKTSIVFDSKIISGKASVFPCHEGLLIHSEYYGNLLYFIEGDSGDLIELFTVPCDRSVSAVNVHEDMVFLSFKRYEDYDTVFAKRFENDNVEGTYRIDLRDYSVVKISDAVYDGLYIFDDTGIYACDDGYNIHKLDYDGKYLFTLLEN